MADDFEERIAKEEAEGLRARMEDAPPPGMLPDGTLNVVSADAPPFSPEITLSDQQEAEAEEAVGETPDSTLEDDDADIEDLSDLDDDE